ncbi:hypothetical protein Salat_1745400 [Sesamum alatum]|uniref:BED-type domain-containing protein n=1 Tax=Sesamum alatum TaxID=300844 RepID=A0AAE1Y897_9LAMI|nr:hypothetical protein Salat_1745400 [Sesamum alatum]
MASASDEAFHGNDSSSGTPGTPGSPGSNESDVPEEFYIFWDFICPELFRDNVPHNTSALQGEGWVAEIMSTPHAGRFYDNIRMIKACFYALVDALSVRGVLPHGQTSRVIERLETLASPSPTTSPASPNSVVVAVSNRRPQLSPANSTSSIMQSEEEILEQTINATNEERTIGSEENVEANKDDETLGSKPKRKKKTQQFGKISLNMKDSDGVMKIFCIQCKRMYTKSKTVATTQLHLHFQTCANYLKAKVEKSKDGLLQTQLGFVSRSVDPTACPSLYVGKFDMEKMKESVAHWIMMHEHPFSIVEKEGSNLMQRRGMPEWREMTRNTTKAYCINVYESEKKKLKTLLKNVNKISLTTECWKSKNQKIEYMVITGPWIDES